MKKLPHLATPSPPRWRPRSGGPRTPWELSGEKKVTQLLERPTKWNFLYTWSWIYIISENLQHTKYSGGFGGVFCCCQATSVTAEKLSWTRILNERNANERASFPATLFAPRTAKYDAIWAGEPFERGGEEMGAILGLLCNFWGRFVGFVSGIEKIDRVTNARQI